ncbi:hypothetical protein HF521_020350 [Silurus meridionalis]|uniref:PDZ domain-containing protein n=1 Tax=Silurus meridionalis TaxID=175797 RepID=A0A8T0BDD6_SILME|nr:hypothetical protein HF521_020350 [Silurus meridionalis]
MLLRSWFFTPLQFEHELLYPVLPSLLDTNPFSGNGQVQISNEVAGVLDIFTKTLNLMKDYRVHPEISRQLFTYLFFFINAFLFNLLMERGSGGSFYHWSCGVQIRADVDVNLLATTREHLLQCEFPEPLEAKCTKTKVLPKAHMEQGHAPLMMPKNCDSSTCSSVSGDEGTCEVLLTPKVKALELQDRELKADETRNQTPTYEDPHRIKQEEGGCGRHNEAGDDEVFMVKLLRGPEGLGLSLVDGVETPMKTNGIYVKSVIPGSPAALSQRLRPGDRLLAINGDGLVGLDYHT